MLRGRIVSAGGTPVENIKPREDAAWVLQSDRGLTYGNEIPAGSRLVELYEPLIARAWEAAA